MSARAAARVCASGPTSGVCRGIMLGAMSGDEKSDGSLRRPRAIGRPRVPPGPLADLKVLVYQLYQLYLEAGTPTLDEIAAWIAADEDEDLAGAPGRDTISRIIGDARLPASQADVVAVVSVLARAARWDRRDAAGRAVHLWVAARMATPVGVPLAEVTDPFALEVHRPVQPGQEQAGLPDLPSYLPREHDATLARVITAAVQGRSQLAVLVGGSSTGKTRACWEALHLLRDLAGPWRLWHPIDPTRPAAALRDLPGIRPRTVVWLNEAQFYLEVAEGGLGEQVAAGLRELLRNPGRAPVLVLATLWPQFWDTLTARPDGGDDRHAQARDLLAGHDIAVPAALTPAQVRQLTGAEDPRLALAAAAAKEDGQVIQFLAGAPELLARYHNAPPAAAALISAAMDARRLGMGAGLPQAFLEAAAPGYLTDPEWDALGEDWLEQALAYTAVPCKGARGPLTRIRPRPARHAAHTRGGQHASTAAAAGPLYRLADYLDQHGRAHRASQDPPAEFWSAAAAHPVPGDQAAATVEQAERAIQDIATRAGLGQIFPATDQPGERIHEDSPLTPNPFASSSRPRFVTEISQVVKAAQEDVEHLIWQRRAMPPRRPGAEPDLVMTIFAQRDLTEEAEDPEKFRNVIRELLREGGTVEVLIQQAAEDLVALVSQMISYLGQGGPRYQAHLIDESGHPLAYDIYIAGDRGLLVTRSDGGQTVAVRTNDPDDVAALRDLLRPYWENEEPILQEAGRRTRETVAGHSPEPSIALPFERLLTTVEVEEGPRRLFKEGLSILNIPTAIHAWKWRAAELCTAGWIPPDLLEVLHAQAWDLAKHGLRQLLPTVLDKYPVGGRVRKALEALEEYARGLQVRHAAWDDQLTRHQFWDACPKSALRQFISTGELPPDEIPPACGYRAERGDIETIITRLITRLRSSRNYHLALIGDLRPFPLWFYFGVKEAHVIAQIFDSPPAGGANEAARPGNDMLNVHIQYAPTAEAFAGWFDERVLTTAVHPAWQDNRGVADWLENELIHQR